MAMSNLAAQLAGLNDSAGGNNKNVGSVLPSSLRHEEAIGRGLHHSVHVGHSMMIGGDPRFKPSVLWDDAKAASDVPLSTLWENCHAALVDLSADVYPPLQAYTSVCQDALLQRPSPQKNNKKKNTTTPPATSLTQLLTILSTLYSHSGSATTQNCLHILEYLVRRYNIHVTAADTLLMTFLPHAEALPVLFHRILQLVNIAGNGNQSCWIWLRPYARAATKDGGTATTSSVRPPPPPRHVVAKHAIPNTALLHQICTLTQNVANLAASSAAGQQQPHRGLAQVMSWSATLIVQGLAQLQKVETSNANLESVLRSLLPFVLSATSSSAGLQDWTVWGHVVASALAETMELAPAVQQVLCCSIMKGAVLATVNTNDSDSDDDSPATNITRAGDAIVAVMAVCMPLHNNSSNSSSMWNATRETYKSDLWLPYPTVFEQMLSLQDVLPLCLCHLYQERQIDISSLMTNLILLSVLHNANHDDQNLVVGLIEQQDGLEQVWKTDGMAQNLAEWLVWTYLHDDNDKEDASEGGDDKDKKLQFYQELLQALRRVDPKGCEQGMAEAMQDETAMVVLPGSSTNNQKKNKLAALLEGVLPVSAQIKGGKSSSSKTSISTAWLPPHVALEHADPILRLQAIQQLVKEHLSLSSDKDVIMRDDDDTEALEQGLSRRMASDEDPDVVLAATVALKQVMRTASMLSQGMTRDVVATLYQWSSFTKPQQQRQQPQKGKTDRKSKSGNTDSTDTTRQSIIVHCLQLLGHAPQTQLTLESVVAHVSHWNQDIVEAAASSIVQVLGGRNTTDSPRKGKSPKSKSASKKANPVDQAKQLLLVEDDFGAGLLLERDTRGDASSKDTELALRRRSLWIMLDARAEYVQSHQEKGSNEDLSRQSQAALEACLFLLSSKVEGDTWKKNPSRTQTVKNVWKTCVKWVRAEIISKLLLSLASVAKEKVYESMGKELAQATVENITDEGDNSVAVYSVLMEAALQEDASVVAVKRLVSLAVAYLQEGPATKKKYPGSWYCVAPSLTLIEHPDESVRIASLDLLAQWSANLSSKKSDAKWKPLSAVCRDVVKNKASATLGGTTFLPKCLAAAAGASTDCRDCLLDLVLSAAVACGKESVKSLDEAMDSKWLPFGQASGQASAAVALLRAMELAGEAAFPLKLRWDVIGARMQDMLLNTEIDSTELPTGLLLLSDAVVDMLKGVSVADASSLETVVISMGPGSSGRRQRSYSVGKAEGVTYIDPYPKPMSDSIVEILGHCGQERNLVVENLCKSVVEKILGRESWAESVFNTLPVGTKRQIAYELLSMLAGSTRQIPVKFFFDLPLDATDVGYLKKECTKSASELAAVSILADYIRSNNGRLMDSPGSKELVKTLFSSLSSLSSFSNDDSDEVEYVRQSILSATSDLLSNNADREKVLKIAEQEVTGWVNLLLSLNGNETALKDVRPLVSQRAKGVALSLLTALCSNFPKPVVSSLIPAMTTQMEGLEAAAMEDNMADHMRGTFDSILPVYWKYASSANLSFHNLLSAFAATVRSITSQKKRAGLYSCLIQAITDCKFAAHDDPAVGAVVAYYFAGEVHASTLSGSTFGEELHSLTEFALQIMQETTGSVQVSSILLMLHYADSLLLMLQPDVNQSAPSSTSFDDSESYLPKAKEVVQIALSGPSAASGKKVAAKITAKKQGAVMDFAQVLLLAVNDALLAESVRKFIRRSERNNTTLSLRLWQDLLVLQSTASATAAAMDDDTNYWETTIRLAGESLEHIQTLMPLPTFLASATSLIKEAETDELRAGAIRLVADRAPEVRPGTPEAQLFLDVASLLVGFLKAPDKHASSTDGSNVLQQSAFVAIEHIARGHHTASSQTSGNPSEGNQTFMSALQGCADIFVSTCGQGKHITVDIGKLDDAARKLLCSAALCTATLVRVTAPRCIGLLPKFMNQLVACLCSVNNFVTSTKEDQTEVLSDARITQVCLLRALTSVADSVPQFIYPYLKLLLAPSALPSGSLRSEAMDQAVGFAADALEKSLSAHVPARVLLPAVSKSIASVTNPVEFDVLLKLLKHSIDASSGEELVGHLGSILKAVTTTYDFKCEHSARMTLLDSANEGVLALVMKLSENHLRRLYSSLRDWRGGLHTEDPDKFALRRFAFWKVSAVLGRELRTIFLSCLAGVLADAVDELNLAAAELCTPRKSEKSGDGKKKRRLDDESGAGQPAFSADCMLSIQPLLSCLEFALRADAQDGGKWVRADDGQRYRSLLEPMGKLLQARVPANFPTDGDLESPFQSLVQGVEEAVAGSGSVIGCLSALASAAGNEQLWKPLNHAVLDACGNRGRSEVRKAGLECLLSLMKSLGEEYMVLLPECLPILAELLEDNDEEVAGLAQDCITLGEDLLGESLEESLR